MEIPGYYLIDTLGEGDAATVHLAIREDVEQEVALKIFSRERSSERAFREQLVRQARRLQDLDHPNIVSLYGHGRHQGRLYLAMEYVRGHTLAHRRFDLGLPEQLQVVESVAQALHYVSQRGFVHGNITPDNIMLRHGDDCPLVMGIGAKLVDENAQQQAQHGKLAGQRRYLSPEQRHGKKPSQRSDVYSLGRVLLLLLQAQVPRPIARQFEVDPGHLAPALAVFAPILKKSLASNPSRRYASCGELGEALADLSRSQIHQAADAAEQALMSAGSGTGGERTGRSAEGPETGPLAHPVSLMTLHRELHSELAPRSAESGADSRASSVPVQPDDRIESAETTAQSGWSSAVVWALLVVITAGAVLFGVQAAG